MRKELSGHTVCGKRVAAQSAHRKRIGSAPTRKSAVNRQFATKPCGRAIRGCVPPTARQDPGVPPILRSFGSALICIRAVFQHDSSGTVDEVARLKDILHATHPEEVGLQTVERAQYAAASAR
jgi:hypothetical protein